MKREIKRLQRLRDIFRQNVNNPAIVEQHRLVEARKRIETVSEHTTADIENKRVRIWFSFFHFNHHFLLPSFLTH